MSVIDQFPRIDVVLRIGKPLRQLQETDLFFSHVLTKNRAGNLRKKKTDIEVVFCEAMPFSKFVPSLQHLLSELRLNCI
ncbi:MAG: hypothetical protein AAGK70_17250 [Pseudomonadota bacterium]